MVDVKKFLDKDLYGLLDIDMASEEADIRKAYRRKALACHPDKNPDNPKAAELFHELSKALEVLLDKAARSAYDRVILARKAAEIRNKQLDSKRQKLKFDLEARERAAQSQSQSGDAADNEMQRLITLLRADGSRLLEEEQLLLQQQLNEERQKQNVWNSAQHRIKIKWKASSKSNVADLSSNGGYNESNLRRFLQKYGDLEAFVMSAKHGSAMVEFRTQDAAEMAVAYEKGLLDNPLTLSWIGEAPRSRTAQTKSSSSTITDSDFESIVLRQMRQAEERKRLIAQMEKEDAES